MIRKIQLQQNIDRSGYYEIDFEYTGSFADEAPQEGDMVLLVSGDGTVRRLCVISDTFGREMTGHLINTPKHLFDAIINGIGESKILEF